MELRLADLARPIAAQFARCHVASIDNAEHVEKLAPDAKVGGAEGI
jgi:hypothetical protein